MFKNYRELFVGYLDLYSTSLFGSSKRNAGRQQLVPCAPHSHSSQLTFAECLANTSESFHQQEVPSPLESFQFGLVHLNNKLTKSGLVGGRLLLPNGHLSGLLEPDLGSRLVDEQGNETTIGSLNGLQAADLLYMLSLFVTLVLAKRLLVAKLRQFGYLSKLGLRAKDRQRVDECVWRLLFYSFSSTWLVYICFIRHDSRILFTTSSGAGGSMIEDHKQEALYSFQVDWPSYQICMIEAVFYLHATYALLWEDVWRRDSPMMLVHHMAAVFSVLGVYATRTHQIGLASTVLRDTCDVLLEAAKLAKCLHVQHGKRVASIEWPMKLALCLFTLAFAINQLYYYPLFCLYHGLNLIKVHHLQTPVMVGIATCGLIFLLLDCFWFMLILRLLYNMTFASLLDDLREYDEQNDDGHVQEKGPLINGDATSPADRTRQKIE